MTTIITGQVVTAAQINQWAPPGAISAYGGATAPTGWLLCDGASYLRTDYPDLFTAISTTYGAADGTHFNVPDIRGRVPVGYAASGGHTDVSALNNNDGQATANRRPKHRTSEPSHVHPITNVSDIPNSGIANAAGDQASPTLGPVAGGSGTIGIGTANANDALDTPSYIVLNYIIRGKDA